MCYLYQKYFSKSSFYLTKCCRLLDFFFISVLLKNNTHWFALRSAHRSSTNIENNISWILLDYTWNLSILFPNPLFPESLFISIYIFILISICNDSKVEKQNGSDTLSNCLNFSLHSYLFLQSWSDCHKL